MYRSTRDGQVLRLAYSGEGFDQRTEDPLEVVEEGVRWTWEAGPDALCNLSAADCVGVWRGRSTRLTYPD